MTEPRGTETDPLITKPAIPIPKGTTGDPISTQASALPDPNKTFGISNVILQAIIAAAVTIIVARAQYQTKATVEEVKTTGELNHQLLNSGKLEMQRVLAISTAFKAMTTHDAVDVAAAKEAEDQYQAHKKEADQMAEEAAAKLKK